LHFGVLHLAINMWVLWDAGRLVERLTGNVGYVLLYLFSGVMGNIVSLVWNADKVGAGASGAVFGVIGALGGFLLLRRDTVPMQMLSGLRSSLGAFVILNLVIGYAIPFIDLSAHMGGLAAGAVCGMVMSRPITREHTGGRMLRNLAVLALAGIAVPLGLAVLPAAPEDPVRLIEELGATENRVLDRFAEVEQQFEAGELTEDEAADRLDEEVLGPWSEMRERMEGASRSTVLNRDVLAKLLEYLRLREESFRHRIAALRTGEEAQQRQFLEKQQAASELARQLAS
jgi:rhomboid protease GluP